MSLKVLVKVPVRLFTTEEVSCLETMPPNWVAKRSLVLPFDFVPDTLHLTHCPVADGGQTVDGSKVLLLTVRVKATAWNELDGSSITVHCHILNWHYRSFARAIGTMGEHGWSMEKV